MNNIRNGENPLTNAERQKRFRDRHRTTPIMKPAPKVKQHMTDDELIDFINDSFTQGAFDHIIAPEG